MSRIRGTRQSYLDNNIMERINIIPEKDFFSKETTTGKQKNKNNDEFSNRRTRLDDEKKQTICRQQTT